MPRPLSVVPDLRTRRLGEDDRAAADELRRLAFGGVRPPPDRVAPPPRPGDNTWGILDGPRLVATAMDREFTQFFGGRPVPASGLAGVAVAPADRGRGHARALLTTLFGAARDRGASILALFPTAPALYRGVGCEHVGTLTWSDLPTAALGRIRLPAGMTLRAAGAADEASVADLYAGVARAGNGYLDRGGPGSPLEGLSSRDGVTLAVGADGGIEGYVSWDRGEGYESEARLTVFDLIGSTGPATTALLAALGTWGAVTPTLRLRLPDPDPVQWLLPATVPLAWKVQPWMLRILDAAAAVEARGWPAHAAATVDLTILDEHCPWNAGRRRLEISGGSGRLVPGGAGTVTVSARGLAVLYAGGVTAGAVRRAGLIEGGSAADDRALDALASGPRPAILDFF